jgi:hypothetical protein
MEPMPSRAARTAYVVLTVLFWITIVAGVVLVAHRLFGLLQDSQTLSVPASANVEDAGLPEAYEIAGPLPVTVDVDDPTLGQRVVATVPTLVWWTLAVVVLWLLRKIARSAAEGDPFRASNATRLRRLGALFLVGFPLATVVEGFFTNWFFAGIHLPPGGITIAFPVVSGPAIMAAVCLFALAEVFAHGARLREDVDATI